MVFPIYLQLIAALIVIIVLYIITLLILRTDSIMASTDNKVHPNEIIKVIDGYGTVAQLSNFTYNTYNPYASDYKMIPRSIDSKGGASFTYQFWMKIKSTSDSLYADNGGQIILLKGDNRQYQTGLYSQSTTNSIVCPSSPDKVSTWSGSSGVVGGAPLTSATGCTNGQVQTATCTPNGWQTTGCAVPAAATTTTPSATPYTLQRTTPADYAIKAPLIKFGSSYRELIVQFNTNNVPNYQVDIVMTPPESSAAYVPGLPRRNLLSIIPLNWFLFTFVFEDSYSVLDSSANGIKMSFYVNDFPYEIVSANTDPLLKNNTLVQNDGDLYLFPNLTSVGDFLEIADLGYFSSALQPDDIRKTFQNGPTLTPMKVESTKIPKMNSNMLSAFNKMDIYNK